MTMKDVFEFIGTYPMWSRLLMLTFAVGIVALLMFSRMTSPEPSPASSDVLSGSRDLAESKPARDSLGSGAEPSPANSSVASDLTGNAPAGVVLPQGEAEGLSGPSTSQDRPHYRTMTIRRGNSEIDEATGIVVGVTGVDIQRRASLLVTYPDHMARPQPNVVAGTVWSFKAEGKEHRLVVRSVDYATDTVVLEVRP